MTSKQWHPKGLKRHGNGLHIVQKLATLRQQIEKGTARLSEIDLPAALLLYDVCKVIGLTLSDQRKVLGRDGTRYVKMFFDVPIKLKRGRTPKKRTSAQD